MPGVRRCVQAAFGLAAGLAGVGYDSARAQQAIEIERLPAHARASLAIEQLSPARRTGRVVLTLPGGETLRLIPEPRERRMDGTWTLSASSGTDRLLVTTDGTRAYGHAVVGDKTYLIATMPAASKAATTESPATKVESTDAAATKAAQVAIVDADRLGGPRTAAGTWRNDVVFNAATYSDLLAKAKGAANATAASVDAGAPSTVDVALFVEGRVEEQHGPQAVRTRAQAWVEFTNAAFQRNGIALSLRLVYLGPFAGTLPANDTLFEAFQANVAAQDTALLYGADLRHLVYSQDSRPGLDNCGRANLLGPAGATGFECGQHLFAHEIGHNFGAHHDRAHAQAPAPSAGDFNFGYVCGGRGTLMSYAGASSLDHYSSPDLSFGGQSCGVAIGQPDAAFNGAAIDRNRVTLAGLAAPQPAFGTVRFATQSLSLDEKGAGLPLTIVREGDLSRTASVEVGLIDGTATEGEDVRPLLQRVTFAPGENARTLIVEPIDDEAFDGGVESLRAVLRYPLQVAVAGEALEISIAGDDDLDRGRASFESSAASVRENARQVQIQVRRDGLAAEPLTVSFLPVDETARNGAHYRLDAGQVAFSAGETRKAIAVEILDDSIYQGAQASRYFTVRLTGPNVGATRELRLFVYDDELASPTRAARESGEKGGGGTNLLALLALAFALRVRQRQCTQAKVSSTERGPGVRAGA